MHFHISENLIAIVGAFYYMLGNVRPQFRSRISDIQLLQLVQYGTVEEFGIDRVMTRIVEDLRKLESVCATQSICVYLYSSSLVH